MSNLIGLGGYAESGKDAFADVLEKHGWYKTYMSKYLRKSLEILNPIVSVDMLTGRLTRFAELVEQVGYEESKKNSEVRRLLQTLGTEVGRKLYSEYFWVDLCFKEVVDELEKGNSVVVTGIRYLNELHKLHNLDGNSVWVDRPGYGPVNQHSSDNSLTKDDFDHVFNNGGSLKDLETAVPEFLGFQLNMPVVVDRWKDIGFKTDGLPVL